MVEIQSLLTLVDDIVDDAAWPSVDAIRSDINQNTIFCIDILASHIAEYTSPNGATRDLACLRAKVAGGDTGQTVQCRLDDGGVPDSGHIGQAEEPPHKR